ncbi:MAG TPA: polyphenol oxidase family protein [Actinomycetales bacterium]|nr:polyphenol oxidase family protein [Actinomycetales bacterium]
MFALDEQAPGCRFVVTDRLGGASREPYGTLNLGGGVGDDEEAVRTNRCRVADSLGVAADHLLFMDQVHGDEVVQVDGPWRGPVPRCDAMVTTRPGLALAVLVADCVPVLLAAPREGVLGVAHAGRAGMAAGVVERLVEAMHDLGARTITARVGPSVCPRCYPVGQQLADEVAARWPVTRSVSRHGEPSLDVAAGVLAQLAASCRDLDQVPGCTVERPDLFSYRRDGRTGRFAGIGLLTELTGAADPAVQYHHSSGTGPRAGEEAP